MIVFGAHAGHPTLSKTETAKSAYKMLRCPNLVFLGFVVILWLVSGLFVQLCELQQG